MPARRPQPVRTQPRRPQPRAAALLAAALLLAGMLAACGGSVEEPAPTAQDTIPARVGEPRQVPVASAPSGSDEGTAGKGSSAGGPTDGAASDGEAADGRAPGAAPPTRTRISGVWPDESWQVEELPGDACEGRAPQRTRWAIGEARFACGAPADLLIACAPVGGDEALCLQDVSERRAARIHSPAIAGYAEPAMEQPHPMLVVLADGTICEAVGRDDMDHNAGRQSWLHCGEDSALLLDQRSASEYFDREDGLWTAELGVGARAPRTVAVREAVFAATEEDLDEHGWELGWRPE
ncbi:hypothetical protein [Brachybacterium aquaticum]|uniref:Uncharacterized protein n=1 Tax=Brachybacterium aquaticum TaxID=1432564 RepID=A0A841AC94_9MICO|nr:hypothetical protein [Brachybacterium aquaticum]MBB5832859.1 hypothetical protein [Brachybacterium aquaticum]